MMTSSTKPEVHSISQRCQRRTEPRPQATCTKNWGKFGRVVSEIRERTDRQTYSSQYFAASKCAFSTIYIERMYARIVQLLARSSLSIQVLQQSVSSIGIELSPIPCVGRSVCRSVRKVYCDKTADWIPIPFGVVSGIGRVIGILDGW